MCRMLTITVIGGLSSFGGLGGSSSSGSSDSGASSAGPTYGKRVAFRA